MTVELRPLGVTCNLACHYCYQNPQRDAGNARMSYDLEKMKSAAKASGGPFTLFGGEPLMMRFDDLEHLFAWGLETFGENAIQTNGVLIESRHIALFRRYKVSVGVSIDGPGALNDARWHRGLEKTRRSTELVQQAIARLCAEHEPPGLIVTLHRGNATADKLPAMFDWLRALDAMGIRSVRLHLLEVDHHAVRGSLALSPAENIAALCAFAELESTLAGIRFDLFREMEDLLAGNDKKASCTWRACDPYTTSAVQGVEGDGQTSNCGRTNKDGIGFIKADVAGYERYLALARTPQTAHGCRGCRFFLMCKGQCPGTAVDGDWRNRTEHCAEWMHLFALIERRMILAGKIPLTIQPLRLDVERGQVQNWARGENPPIKWIIANLYKERVERGDAPATPTSVTPIPALPPRPRVSWVSDGARSLWQPRLSRIRDMLADMTVHEAETCGQDRCAVRVVPRDHVPRLKGMAIGRGLEACVLPEAALPNGVPTDPGASVSVTLLVGSAYAVRRAEAAFQSGQHDAFAAMLHLPDCCRRHAACLAPPCPDTIDLMLPESQATHALLAPLGLCVLPILPCKWDCQAANDTAERCLTLAAQRGYEEEVGWLHACFGWAVSRSARHGVVEIKTPVLKLTFLAADFGPREVRRLGSTSVEGAVAGLSFPFADPARAARALRPH